MITVHDILGNTRFFRACEYSEVPAHFEKIKHWITDEPHEKFKSRMESCIKAGTAFTMNTDTAFLYYENINSGVAKGVALYGKGNPVDMLALFAGIFDHADTKIFKMDFRLHPGKFIEEYKSLITKISAKRNAHHGNPLVVRIDKIKQKVHRIEKTRESK